MSPERSPIASGRPEPERVAGRPGFRSFKTVATIVYPQRWHRDLLIQATLDPAIEALASVDDASILDGEFAVDVWFGSRRRRLLAVRDTLVGGYEPADALVISRSFVLSEPRCSAARQIWASRKTIVPMGDRMRILGELARHPGGVALQRLMECVRADVTEPVDVVLALVCAGQAEMEIRTHLSPDATLRLPRVQMRGSEKSSISSVA